MINKNRIWITDENSFLKLTESADGPRLSRGHARFHKDILSSDEPRIYTDNVTRAPLSESYFAAAP